MAAPELVLRDIHVPPAPPWWPPAPGWWLVGAGVVALALLLSWLAARRRRRARAIAALFDDVPVHAQTPAEQVAAISELLRRAARRIDPAADTLQGGAWLQLLDRNSRTPQFSGTQIGQLLLEGPFRGDVDEHVLAQLRVAARQRFIAWMQPRPRARHRPPIAAKRLPASTRQGTTA